MQVPWREAIWQQFGASIATLEHTMRACPDELWHARLWENPAERPELSQFWYIVYHTLFWIDLYLTGTEEGFVPPPPFTLIEQDDDGPIPERPYTRAELLAYLADCRSKCQTTIATLTDEAAVRRCHFGWGEVSFVELLIYSMRHVHGHASQLNLLLGQNRVSAPNWVPLVKA